MNKCYPIENSPLYRLRNRRRLTEFLNLPKTILRKNILIVIMSFRDRSPMEMEKDILLYR